MKDMLAQRAWAAKRANNSSYQAQFLRLVGARRGPQKAICAVAASLLTAIYHMLRTEPSTKISASPTSTTARPRRKPIGSCAKSKGSAIR
jgi:hypothetical protein